MRVLFFGTPEWAVLALEALIDAGHEIAGVVTAPDAPVGRSRTPVPPPVARAALDRGVGPILQPTTLRGRDARAPLYATEPHVHAVVAYGRILPGKVLDAPPHGSINVHFSLLPRHRGASPVQHTLLAGDDEAGVTTMKMDRGLDTGPMLLRRATPIAPGETAPELGERLARIGAELLVETLAGLEAGTLAPVPQDHDRATHAPPLTREDGHVRWDAPAIEIERRVRAFAQWPPVVCKGPKGVIRVRRARASDRSGEAGATPGRVLGREGDAVLVACGGGSVLAVEEVQPAGKKTMNAAAALAGRHFAPGDVLEPGG